MSRWIIPPIAGLIEPAVAPEFFIDNVGAIELIGSCIRVYYCAEQMPLECTGETAQMIVTAKIVRPLSSVPAAIGRLAECLSFDVSKHPTRPNGGAWPRLVK